ncbi:MAG: hypothetical protein HY559_04705 [Gammaproteobacteria bacterium]|nr:hypothetical protein [Gammaproteobacteria bacterium]
MSQNDSQTTPSGVNNLAIEKILELERRVFALVTPPTQVIATCGRIADTMQKVDWQGLAEQARDIQVAFNAVERSLSQRVAFLLGTAKVVGKCEEAVQGMLVLIQSVAEMSATSFVGLSTQVSKLGEMSEALDGLFKQIQANSIPSEEKTEEPQS